jgi:hypothetical protein
LYGQPDSSVASVAGVATQSAIASRVEPYQFMPMA